MPELRQNIITRDWVIIARDRSRRPNEFAVPRAAPTPIPRYDPACPFCPGNESMTVSEVFRDSDGANWRVRIVGNKFPALLPDGETERRIQGIHRSMRGVGFHEVVIEHPRHDLSPALYPAADLARVLLAFRHRSKQLRDDPRVEAVIIFKNHGEAAGTSLIHPHAQIAATPVVPNQIRRRLEEAIRYFDDTGTCVYCQTVREELRARERIVCETPHFVAFIPYAALSPFHIWIFPRRHCSSFEDIFDSELEDFAEILHEVLLRLYLALGNPDYNFTLRSLPAREPQRDYAHWYLALVPRVSRVAGFEMGSGMYINPSVPEESAEFLRSVTLPIHV
jgi:UDPglucose--hexose-1-phosphate uridylyltransferase